VNAWRAAAALLALALVTCAQAATVDEQLTAARADGSAITIDITRDIAALRLPIVLAIDGSGCIPSRLGTTISRLVPDASVPRPYALVTVEKPAPTRPVPDADGQIRIGPDFRCTDEFKRYYTIDQRATDHLLAIASLRRQAPWWNGELLIWGFSDGGHVGAQVAVVAAETHRVVLGAFGGGIPMARLFEDHFECGAAAPADKATCVAATRERFEAMRRDPSRIRTHFGDSNTWAAWASRIDSLPAALLMGLPVPLLVWHFERDDSVPVTSARALRDELALTGQPFEYREIPGWGHGFGGEVTRPIQMELRNWLLRVEPRR
jgi:hypothetical protein